MIKHPLIGPWVRRFLLEYLVTDRNFAHNTQLSYRDTLLLLLPFLSQTQNKALDRLTLDDLSPAAVRAFLDHVENERGCSIATRNLRLAMIHSLAKFIALNSPEQIAWYATLRAVPFKKTAKNTLTYLDKLEMDALLETPDQQTLQGRRDYAVLLFLYNTGARASEAAQLTVGDIAWGSAPAVRLFGKGNKVRWCPIWACTQDVLKQIVAARSPQQAVFLNRRGQPLTRYGIYSLVHRTVAKTSQVVASLKTKQISPHCLRHTCAVNLLRAGVDINTIRAWLGHVSLDTTNIYAEVDLEMKANALAHCDLPEAAATKSWHTDEGMIGFLKSL